MKYVLTMPRSKGLRFSRYTISCLVEDLLTERDIIVRGATIRLWVKRFGSHFAACIRRDRRRAARKWHIDEVVIRINGVKYWLGARLIPLEMIWIIFVQP